jgi:hypothetical protein
LTFRDWKVFLPMQAFLSGHVVFSFHDTRNAQGRSYCHA